MIPVVTPAEMGAVDAAAPEPLDVLVERAGAAVARTALRMLGGSYGRTIAIVCGPGNNGLDGRVAARRLRRRGCRVFEFAVADVPPELPACDLVIDAAFGTGYRVGDRPPFVFPGTLAPVLAVDIASGIDGMTGEAVGAPVRADRTITFQALKPGLLFADGPRLSGDVEVVDIGLGPGVADRASTHLVTDVDVRAWWPRRRRAAHKWHSAAHLIAGSADMPGAAVLAAGAVSRAGAGYVALSSPGATPVGAPTEAVLRSLPADDWAESVLADHERFGALAIGPGMGRSAATGEGVRSVVRQAVRPIVIDGDALHAVAFDVGVVSSRREATVLTPHDGEFAQLTGEPPGADRIAAAKHLAARTAGIVLLKGPTTVVTDSSATLVVDHGDERLATAGSGDVLTGIITAGLACGGDPLRTAAAAAWLHADAGRRAGSAGVVAGDLVEALPQVLGALRSERSGVT